MRALAAVVEHGRQVVQHALALVVSRRCEPLGHVDDAAEVDERVALLPVLGLGVVDEPQEREVQDLRASGLTGPASMRTGGIETSSV